MNQRTLVGGIAMLGLLGATGTAWGQGVPAQVVDIHEDDPGIAMPARPAPVVVPLPTERERPLDPAHRRLALSSTAELLRRGEVSFVSRGMVTTELAWGAADWLELGIKATPLFTIIPGIGPQGSLWLGGLRLRLARTALFTLAADADGLSFLGWAGLRAGLAAKLGTDRFAVHGSAAALQLWQVSTLGGGEDMASRGPCPVSMGCSTGNSSRPTLTALLASGGAEVRLARSVKLIADVTYYRDRSFDMLLVAPAVRLHGRHFAADLGVVAVKTAAASFAVPLFSLSVTY